MKKFFTALVALMVVMLLPNSDVMASYKNEAGHRVDEVTESGLELYMSNSSSENSDVDIVGYIGKSSKVVIPEKIGKHRVRKIERSAFEGNTLITEVELPDSLANIRMRAFKNCTNLKSVTFGDYLGWLEETEPSGSISREWPLRIENEAFSGCTSFEKIELTYGAIILLNNDGYEKSVFAGSGLKEAVICLSQWDDFCNIFNGADSLKKITIKSREDGKFIESQCTISDGWFSNLKSLETVEVYNAERVLFSNSYYTSGKEYRETFVNCPKLMSVNLYYGMQKADGFVYNIQSRDSAPFIGTVLSSSVPESAKHYIKSSDSSVIEIDKSNKVKGLLHNGTAKLSCELLPFEVNVIVGDGKGNKADLKDAVIEIPVSSATYTGEEIVPYIVVSYDGKVLAEGKDYTVKCTDNINIGKAVATITGIGDYCGNKAKEYSIVPVTVILKSVSAKKSQYTLSWNKNALATGYEIYYSSKKSSGYKKLGSTTGLSLSSDKLKIGMYVKVRSYTKVGSKKYYSVYSTPVKLR